MLPDTQAATPCREPWCVLPRRPKSRAALRCQADERTAPSQPTGPKVAPSRFTASTSRALLRGGCGATVRRSAAGGGRQTRARRASIPAASWVARRPPAAFGWGASPLGWAAAQLLHLWGLVGAPPAPPPLVPTRAQGGGGASGAKKRYEPTDAAPLPRCRCFQGGLAGGMAVFEAAVVTAAAAVRPAASARPPPPPLTCALASPDRRRQLRRRGGTALLWRQEAGVGGGGLTAACLEVQFLCPRPPCGRSCGAVPLGGAAARRGHLQGPVGLTSQQPCTAEECRAGGLPTRYLSGRGWPLFLLQVAVEEGQWTVNGLGGHRGGGGCHWRIAGPRVRHVPRCPQQRGFIAQSAPAGHAVGRLR